MEIDLLKDLKTILINQFISGGLLYDKNLSVEKVVRQYFNIRIREVEIRPRKVHKSKVLESKILRDDHKLALEQIKSNFLTGKSLSPYMSLDLRNPDAFDALLFDWKIHHFHLGIVPEKKDPRFVKRTKHLLFTRVENEDAYLIDILDHDPIASFANQELLEILRAEWPFLLNTLGGISVNTTSAKLTNEQIHTVRSKGAIALFPLSDGKVYFPSGGGQASNGSNVHVTRSTDMLLHHIKAHEKMILEHEERFRTEIVTHKQSCPKILKFKLLSWNEQGVLIEERKTKIQFQTS